MPNNLAVQTNLSSTLLNPEASTKYKCINEAHNYIGMHIEGPQLQENGGFGLLNSFLGGSQFPTQAPGPSMKGKYNDTVIIMIDPYLRCTCMSLVRSLIATVQITEDPQDVNISSGESLN